MISGTIVTSSKRWYESTAPKARVRVTKVRFAGAEQDPESVRERDVDRATFRVDDGVKLG